MTNRTAMIEWLDKRIAVKSNEDEAQLLRDIRNCVFSEMQRKEAEQAEIQRGESLRQKQAAKAA